ncbi:hypothetical protein [Acidovorax sp. sic0104]|uniref:hypothetical protein n=1 Tax=Acidovorax sp. sic0104 TaxID=2854784 RepID=UPI001C45093C|nr:hypothetical protein [Acidovorax sp. sic0104]MBV7542013.1 hypothetical protein [Acidovorax sp. sic0104]
MPAFQGKPHFISGPRNPLAKDAVIDPPIPCHVAVGDIVTYTNDFGVAFHERLVTGFSPTITHGRFVYFDSDSWWFPARPESLTVTKKAGEPAP